MLKRVKCVDGGPCPSVPLCKFFFQLIFLYFFYLGINRKKNREVERKKHGFPFCFFQVKNFPITEKKDKRPLYFFNLSGFWGGEFSFWLHHFFFINFSNRKFSPIGLKDICRQEGKQLSSNRLCHNSTACQGASECRPLPDDDNVEKLGLCCGPAVNGFFFFVFSFIFFLPICICYKCRIFGFGPNSIESKLNIKD